MMDEKKGKQKAKDYYDQEAGDYIKQYQEGYGQYPANLIRIKLIIERLKKNNVKTILDAGCGTCGPMIRLRKEGFDVKGFDFSKDMVEQGKKELELAGYDPELIHFADLEDGSGPPREKFDAILALGVFPHIVDEKRALSNMGKLLNPNGLVFIEFRNDLFATYALNKYSLDFFLNRVIDLSPFPQEVRDKVIDFYSERLKVDKPIKEKSGKIKYKDILAKFRNPLSIKNELFEPCNFSIVDIHFYHYHALPPIFEDKYPKLFRELSLRMERPNDWKGYLMASAYVIEAKKKD
ncbi:MAG: class I SAM-dependent methyltransferase [Candidatus Omnitrophica bacterium]|nr:class I SAM-dependent methyltransferase [Candidatus Omnitrophota bacterium]